MGSRIARIISKIPFIKQEREEGELKIVTRAEWKARVPRWREDLVFPALSATTVYTGTSPCTSPEECTRAVQDIQATHMDQDGLPDIEYSFLVGGDGRVYEGRGWQTISNRSTLIKCVDPEAPPQPTNILFKDVLMNSPDRRVVIAFIGDEEKDKATFLMQSAVRDLINDGIDSFYLYSGENDDVDADSFIKGAQARKKKEEGEVENGESDDEIMIHP